MILSSSLKQTSQNYCENGGTINRKVLSKLIKCSLHIRNHHCKDFFTNRETCIPSNAKKKKTECQSVSVYRMTNASWCFQHSGYLRTKTQKMSLISHAPPEGLLSDLKLNSDTSSLTVWLDPVYPQPISSQSSFREPVPLVPFCPLSQKQSLPSL